MRNFLVATVCAKGDVSRARGPRRPGVFHAHQNSRSVNSRASPQVVPSRRSVLKRPCIFESPWRLWKVGTCGAPPSVSDLIVCGPGWALGFFF